MEFIPFVFCDEVFCRIAENQLGEDYPNFKALKYCAWIEVLDDHIMRRFTYLITSSCVTFSEGELTDDWRDHPIIPELGPDEWMYAIVLRDCFNHKTHISLDEFTQLDRKYLKCEFIGVGDSTRDFCDEFEVKALFKANWRTLYDAILVPDVSHAYTVLFTIHKKSHDIAAMLSKCRIATLELWGGPVLDPAYSAEILSLFIQSGNWQYLSRIILNFRMDENHELARLLIASVDRISDPNFGIWKRFDCRIPVKKEDLKEGMFLFQRPYGRYGPTLEASDWTSDS